MKRRHFQNPLAGRREFEGESTIRSQGGSCHAAGGAYGPATRTQATDQATDRATPALPRVLELGCGFRKEPGAWGVDILPHSQADLVHDLDRTPWPLPSAQFDRVICRDVLEHVERFLPVMEEIHRVCRHGARVEVSAPFASGLNYPTDPTHRRCFTSRSFDYFDPSTERGRYSYSPARFRVLSVRYDTDKRRRWFFDRWLLALADRWKRVYEERFMYWFPVHNVHFVLEALKDDKDDAAQGTPPAPAARKGTS